MYISEAARRVHELYPSEYSDREIYAWCGEVSAMLVTEDRNIYCSAELPVADDGSILLPEGADIENVEYMTANGREIDKRDLRSLGGRRFYVKGLNGRFIENGFDPPASVRVDYLAPFSPIRQPCYRGGFSADAEKGEFTINSYDFREGDIVRIETEPSSSSGTVYDGVPVLAAARTDTGCVLTVPRDTFTAEAESAETALVTRIVTDRTVCPPPFDSMYIDYVLAKIMLYQHDTESANIFMTSFNSMLAAYKNWLIKRMPKGDCRFRNWW